MAFAIANKYKNYIREVIPIYERLMLVVVNACVPLIIIVAYAPPANRTTIEKTNSTTHYTDNTTSTKAEALLPSSVI